MNYLSILITSTLTTGQSALPAIIKEQLVQLEKQEERESQNEEKSQESSTTQVTPPEFMQSDEISSQTPPKLTTNKEDVLQQTRKKLTAKCFSKSRAVKIKMTKIVSPNSSCNGTKSLKLVRRAAMRTKSSHLKLLFASTELSKLSPTTSKLYSQLIVRHRVRYQETGGFGGLNRVINPRSREILPTLRFGHKGIPVKILQRLLIYNGYAITVDGIFGALTETAVKAFQNQRELGVDGVVGNNTWRALSQ